MTDRKALLTKFSARKRVHDNEYEYKKGKSRSVQLDHRNSNKRQKIDASTCTKQLSDLEQRLNNINLSIKMKQNRCQESEKDKNYKLCDELMSDISALLVEQQLIESELSTLKRKEKNRTGITVDDLVPLLIWICLVHHIQVLRMICLVQCQNKQTTLFSLTLFIRASLQHNCYCVRQREAKYNHTIYC